MTEILGLPEFFVKMVQRYAALWHDAKVPEGEARAKFITRILEAFVPDTDRQLTGAYSVAEWIKERDAIAEHLAVAADCVARENAARWAN